MNDREPPSNDFEVEALFRFGDNLATGRLLPPRNELEATALRVQQALRVAGAEPASMPATLKNLIWEEIMEATAPAPTPRKPGIRQRTAGVRASIAVTPPRPAPRAIRARVANVALVLMIVLAMAGAWRSLWNPGGSKSGGNSTVPVVAGTSAVSRLAAATPNAVSGCALRGDIPIITDQTSDTPPLNGTAIYLVRNDRQSVTDRRGTLKLGCPGAPALDLARNVIEVGRGPWPGTVSIYALPPGASDNAAVEPGYVNFITGATIIFPASPSGSTNPFAFAPGSPWVIGSSADDPGTLQIVDLRTMEARPFAQVAGVALPPGVTPFVSTAAADGTLGIGLAGDEWTLTTGSGAPGDLLLLGGSFADKRWVSLPTSFPEITAATLSPDGSHLAVVCAVGDSSDPTAYKYGVIDIASGKEIGESAAISDHDNPFVTWIEGGKAVAYLVGNELQTIAIDGDGKPRTVFTAASQLFSLQTTWNPEVVVAATRRDHGSDGASDQTAQDMVFSVNVKTKEVHTFAGIDASMMVSWIKDAGALVMFQWDDARPETLTYQVFDPVTGKQIGTIADAPAVVVGPRTAPTIGKDSLAVSDDGRVEIFTLGTQNLYAFTATADGLAMRRLTSPSGLLSELFLTARVFLSPDGSQLALSGAEDEGRTRYLMPLNLPGATWLVIPNTAIGGSGSGAITFAEATQSP